MVDGEGNLLPEDEQVNPQPSIGASAPEGAEYKYGEYRWLGAAVLSKGDGLC
jgi:hypothetical protein